MVATVFCAGSPSTAAIPGAPSFESRPRAAFSMSSPRMRTMGNTSAIARTPASHSAAYSPRLNPAQAWGATPRSLRNVLEHRQARVIATWVLSVAVRSSSLESKSSFFMSIRTASEADWNNSLTLGLDSHRSRAIPGYWAPWPGNRKHVFMFPQNSMGMVRGQGGKFVQV